MAKPCIVTCFPHTPEQGSQIRDAAGDRYDVTFASQENIHSEIFNADIFCGHVKTKEPVAWQEVVNQGKLKWIQSSAAGLDHCLHPSVIESSIVVSGCSALFANQVAETSMALLMGLLRSLPVFFRAQQQREYIRRPTNEIAGKTVGILGFGGNGYRIARTLRVMAERIVATDLFPSACQHAIDDGVVDHVFPTHQIGELLTQSDILIVTLPLSDANEKCLNADTFARLKPGAWFINVGRGSVVDQDALIDALKSGHLAGAGIDVADPEPIEQDSPLWTMENVIITPHIGAQSASRVPRTVDFFCENLARYDAGESLLNLVDKQLGFPRPEHRVTLGPFAEDGKRW